MSAPRNAKMEQIALNLFDDWAEETAGHYYDPVVVPSADWHDEYDSHENVWRDLVKRIAKALEEKE